MGARLTIVNIQNDDGYYNAKSHQQHGEKQILAEQGQGERSGWHDLGYEQEEHGL